MPTAIVATTLQAAGLSTLSNVLAQFIKANKEKVTSSITLSPLFFSLEQTLIDRQRSYGVNIRALLSFVIFTLISCPPNILWQDFLEQKFPGYTYHAATGEKYLDKGNTARKLLFDQTLSAFVNTVAFVAAMAAFKGKGLRGIQREVERVSRPKHLREKVRLQGCLDIAADMSNYV